MSTASPLPLQPLPLPTVSEDEQYMLRQQVSARLLEHRRRRPQEAGAADRRVQAVLPGMDLPAAPARRPSRVADSVAARFAQSVSYREFLAQEAEVAIRQAEAAAEVARRNAEAIADAQQRLLEEIEQWNRAAESPTAALDSMAVQARAIRPEAAVLPAMSNSANATAVAPAGIFSASAAATKAPAERTAVPGQTPDLRHPGKHNARDYHAAMEGVSVHTTVAVAELAQPVTMPELPPEPTVALPTNLIEFPRQLVAARKARPRLAEGPLREDADAAPERAQLRIFEVEADAFSTVPASASESVLPEWSSIRLDSWLEPHDTTQPQAQVTVALPLYTAPVSQRVMALGVDLCCIGTAFLLAVAAAAFAAPELPEGKFAVGAAAGTLLLFGVLYLLLCFTFSDATPGMRYARIGLCTFNDENPTRSAMRRRLFAMLLSAVPMGLGFAWAMLDDDRLSWHDRISRMYQRAY